jgi:polysaccharide export outer membrane protein
MSSRPRAIALVVLLLAASAAVAQGPGPYRVGPGDVLEITVAGRPDLSRLPTVQTTGAVWLPRAGPVPVDGLTTAEIAARVAPLLKAEDLPDPQVTVQVKEYQSQFVWVRGAVNRPGRKPLRTGTRLVDALLDAGGFVTGASGVVTVERKDGAFPDGSHSLRVHFGGTDPTPEELQELALPLSPGDLVVAAVQNWVVLGGAVRNPGRYPLTEGATLWALVESAGGLLRSAGDQATVERAGTQIEADIDAIEKGKAEDMPLQPNDVITVKARRL